MRTEMDIFSTKKQKNRSGNFSIAMQSYKLSLPFDVLSISRRISSKALVNAKQNTTSNLVDIINQLKIIHIHIALLIAPLINIHQHIIHRQFHRIKVIIKA